MAVDNYARTTAETAIRIAKKALGIDEATEAEISATSEEETESEG